MAVHNGRPGAGGFQCRVGNLLRRDGNVGAFAHGVASPGNGAGDDDF